MTEQEAVERLNTLTKSDPEQAHLDADGILLEFAPPAVREAWLAANGRIDFWYA